MRTCAKAESEVRAVDREDVRVVALREDTSETICITLYTESDSFIHSFILISNKGPNGH